MSNGQNRVHPEARWPKPGTPFHASPRAPSYWPTPAQTQLWPNLKRVHPILATHPPIGYPIQSHLPDYGRAIRPVPHTRTRHRVIAGRGPGSFLRSTWSCVRTLTLLCSLYVTRLSLARVTKSYLLALGTTQISSYFTKH